MPTVHYTLAFQLLAAEMIMLCLLVAPLPNAVRRKFLTVFAGSQIVANIAYSIKIAFIFVGFLFVNAVYEEWKLRAKPKPADALEKCQNSATKFRAQRNMYLTGLCLFLSLVLSRTLRLVLDLIQTKEEHSKLKKKIAELEAKDRDFETLKKQSQQPATKSNTITNSNSDKRKD